MKTTMIRDLNKAVGNIKVTSEMRKSLLLVLGGAGVVFLLFFVAPWLVEHAWNNFFHATLGLPRFHYLNALSLLFWLGLGVGLVALLKE